MCFTGWVSMEAQVEGEGLVRLDVDQKWLVFYLVVCYSEVEGF